MRRLGFARPVLLVVGLVVCLIFGLVVAFRVLNAGGGCAGCPAGPAAGFSVALHAVGENGAEVTGASAELHGLGADSTPVQVSGATMRTPVLRGPVLAVVRAPGHLAEPVPLGWADAGRTVEVRLFDRTRFAMHSAGDVMFGRRYAAPEQGSPLIPESAPERGAEQVVSAVAPMFSAADLRTVNLESVVSDLPANAAYPQKRFILKSATATTAGLRKLGVDCAVLANNHSRDFLEQGITDTRAALTKAGIGMVGADVTAEGAAVPFRTTVNGTSLAVAGFTSVDGDFVNRAYPTSGTPASPDNAWQYEQRTWGFSGAGVHVPTKPRRIGQAWQEFQRAEPKADRAALWGSLVQVYPELQDWVARRGHGGAAAWDAVSSPAQVAELSKQHQVVVVQLHAGFQFQDSASDNVRAIAHAAIDAGASIVVGHHPHVLQGVEWYKGRLIVYSLGNFVFDQNFLATFSSAILRTVWDGPRLLEARLLPLELVGYRPVPLTGDAARQVLGRIWERGMRPAATDRDRTGAVRAFPRPQPEDTVPGQVVFEHNTGRITATAPADTAKDLVVPPGVLDLGTPPGALTRPTGGAGVELGRDLFGWGRFEDETADGQVDSATHWTTDSSAESAQTGPTPQGRRFLHLTAAPGKSVQTRAVARIALPRHRLFGADTRPLDPAPSYSMRAVVRGSAASTAYFRFGVYHFDDSNPTEDPTSTLLTTITRAVEVPPDGGWHQVSIDLSTADLDTAEGDGNMIMLYAGLQERPDRQSASLDLDDVRFVEWRGADGMTGSFGDFTLARNNDVRPRTLSALVRQAS
ncbi:hypothetical protein Lesp02_75640 [Lentzea sp. NBRC 105346]|uniref:CapA family protein n=1 Tax=Lentzea sp. NBRC 105346 TaxID=3032205 RepID=UPI0024A25745|nr:CapA family protein [Lentzea sp. NBRC 105346]GLZ35377.1 hypothetical protein Lesp02_75640 [Lentzea sp. NBRC 105346]